MVFLLLACTDSKSVEPNPHLRVGEYTQTYSFDKCLKIWTKTLERVLPVCRAGQLYQGGYWWAATRARVDAAIPVRTLVVSAGLGLVDVQDMVPSYAATFTPGTKDSIPEANQSDAGRRWWKGLGGPEKFQQILSEYPDARILSALPQRYLDAALPALVPFSKERGAERLAVLGASKYASKFPELAENWVHLDARMARGTGIGGAAGQLTARTLRWVLDKITDPGQITPSSVREMLPDLEELDATPIYPQRKRCTEEEVRDWLQQAWLSNDPPTSATQALRRFRTSGLAFEQKRFGRLYQALAQEKGA